MADFRHFTTCPASGQTVRLSNVRHMSSTSTKPGAFSGICPTCGELHACERRIERKTKPSNHKCDARCLSAKGVKCECSCGGSIGTRTDSAPAL